MIVYIQVRKYVLAKAGDIRRIRSNADEMTQIFASEKSVV